MRALSIIVFAVVLAIASAGFVGVGLGHGLVGPVGHGIVGHGLGLGWGHGVGVVGVGHVPGDGLEGQYIPSGLEHLHDDGSYRAEHHYAGHNLIFH